MQYDMKYIHDVILEGTVISCYTDHRREAAQELGIEQGTRGNILSV